MKPTLFWTALLWGSALYASENYPAAIENQKGVIVTSDRDRYTDHDTMTVTIRNDLTQAIWINSCVSPFSLLQYDGSNWTEFHPNLRLCIDATPLKIEPKKEFARDLYLKHDFLYPYIAVDLPPAPKHGKSKLKFGYGLNSKDHMKRPLKVFSNEFTVIDKKSVLSTVKLSTGMKRADLESAIRDVTGIKSNYNPQYPTESPTEAQYTDGVITLSVKYNAGAPAPYIHGKDVGRKITVQHYPPIDQTVAAWKITDNFTQGSPQPSGELSCLRDDDCQIVEDYKPAEGNNPAKTLIGCRHKDIPLSGLQRIKEYDQYNEYVRSTCICDSTSKQCKWKK